MVKKSNDSFSYSKLTDLIYIMRFSNNNKEQIIYLNKKEYKELTDSLPLFSYLGDVKDGLVISGYRILVNEKA